MDDLRSYKSYWTIEIRKMFGRPAIPWIYLFFLFLFTAAPWLTLRNFEVNFEEYSWWYLDDSMLHFIIHSTSYRLSWILIIAIPWLFYALFSIEHPHILRKKNDLFPRVLGLKGALYALSIILGLWLMWLSSSLFYQFMCAREMVAPEAGAWASTSRPMFNLGIRAFLVYPLMVVLFLSLRKTWSFIVLIGIILFSSILGVDSAYQFHYNIQHEHFNTRWMGISAVWGALLTIGLWCYYRFFTNRTYVFP